MKLYIIGNGFDNGHGLPTRYWDFRKYLENIYPEFLQAFEEHYNIYSNMSEEKKASLLWNELELNLANIDEDIIIENGVSIELDLEGGDVGIEDTLYLYFSEEYSYIAKLAEYLKQWVKTISIQNVKRKTSLVTNDSLYITFNYTDVLERVYEIDPLNITHIHGSLNEYDIDPVLGHGNQERINKIQERKQEAERLFDEKWASICKVIEDYYKRTFKNVNKYLHRLPDLSKYEIKEINVIGHSLASVDVVYFKQIDKMTKRAAEWNVFFYRPEEKDKLKKGLQNLGIDEKRIQMKPSAEFFDLK